MLQLALEFSVFIRGFLQELSNDVPDLQTEERSVYMLGLEACHWCRTCISTPTIPFNISQKRVLPNLPIEGTFQSLMGVNKQFVCLFINLFMHSLIIHIMLFHYLLTVFTFITTWE